MAAKVKVYSVKYLNDICVWSRGGYFTAKNRGGMLFIDCYVGWWNGINAVSLQANSVRSIS